jgi:small-conductance mechanosensitive channel/osmotically-inducible protein OsmY
MKSLILGIFLALGWGLGLQAQEPPAPTVETLESVEEPVVEVSPDEELATNVRTILDAVDGLKVETVSAKHGIVTLRGNAETVQIRQAAEDIAQDIEGVRYVQNFLITEVVPQAEKTLHSSLSDDAIAEKLNAIYTLIPAMKDIRAEVVSGVVKLRGHASEYSDVERAEALATKTPGVVFVDAQVEVRIEVSKRVAPAWDKAMELGQAFVQRIPLIIIGLILLYVFQLVARFIVPRLPLKRLKDKPLAEEFARNGLRAFIILLGLALALEIWGVSSLVAAFVGTAGIVSIGIGFAFKDVIENYLGGVLLGMRQPFRQNDLVDIGGFSGKVIRLTSRETVLMTLDGNHLTIPNAMVFKSVLYNYTRNPLRRIEFSIGISPSAAFKRVIPLGMETLKETPGVLQEPPPTLQIADVGLYTLNVTCFAWVDQTKNDYFAIRSEAIRRVNQAFLAAGVDMPEPMRRVTMVAVASETEVESLPVDEVPMIDTAVDDTVDKQIQIDEATNPKKSSV